MKIAGVQMSPRLGDFHYNAKQILATVKTLSDHDLIVFPEMSLFGYWPGSLLEQTSLVQQQLKVLKKCHQQIPPNLAVLIGAVTENKKKYGKCYHNSAVLLRKNKKLQCFHKVLLPLYDVFDEPRYFESGCMKDNHFQLKGYKILVTICEDIWADHLIWKATARNSQDPLKKIKKGHFDLVVNLSASPFSTNKAKQRLQTIQSVTQKLSAPVFYTNLVGGQDELIFDGGSLLVDQKGQIQRQAKYFKEDIISYDFKKTLTPAIKTSLPKDHLSLIKQALVLGIRDYVWSAGYTRVHLGLSGGIDSALVACLAVEALGAECMTLIALPGPFSTNLSYSLAQKLAHNLNCLLITWPIIEAYKKITKDLKVKHNMKCEGITDENIQARLRSLYLMTFANENKSLLLATGNKSEIALGYTTLYGDMSGALAPIGDVLKTQVYEIAQKCYASEIPSAIMTRSPTAELKKNQKDSDTLLEYSKIDQSIDRLIVQCKRPVSSVDRWLLQKIKESEFKRWQSPPILRISPHAFGSGRKAPINYFTSKHFNH